ncbi:MAG: hypothetical protein ABSF61_13730 [Anaerolineales bacterium]
MTQLHKQFTADQVKVLLASYEQGHLSREEIGHTLGIRKTRFFALLKQFRHQPESFAVTYYRKRQARLDPQIEDKIKQELMREKGSVENKELPISSYNYAALTDRLKKAGIQVATTTINKRRITLGSHQAKKKKKDLHDREVIVRWLNPSAVLNLRKPSMDFEIDKPGELRFTRMRTDVLEILPFLE